jgi:type I restriction enzyme S subunit
MRLIEVLLPPLKGQRAIADFLDRETCQIDSLIAKQVQLIEALHERRSAVIARELSEVAAGSMIKLKRVAEVQTGVTLSGEGNPDDPEWPYLRVANVQVGFVKLDSITKLRLPAAEARLSMLRPGDVLMTEGGDIDKLGRGALWQGEIPDILHQNHIFAVRPTEQLDSKFLVYWLDGSEARYYFRATAKKTTNLASTNKWTLGNLPIANAPVHEQRQLVARLDEQVAKIGSLIAMANKFIALARERRSALITAAVTGQIDVLQPT